MDTKAQYLAELESSWRTLGIAGEFHKVHHFSNKKFSRQRKNLKEFLNYCERVRIRTENTQTLERALDVARKIKGGQDFQKALNEAWAAFPIATR